MGRRRGRVDRFSGEREVDGTVLTSPQPDRSRPRTQSLRREYEEFMLQRIEEYKEQLSRAELLSLGDEAVRELDAGPEGQLVLTEVLMLDHVDRIIKRRLRLPSFRRWREKHLKLRKAQQIPNHWGLPADTPLTDLAWRLEDDELALIVGIGAAPAGFLLAAHDVNVLLIDQDLAAIEAHEARAASEALGHRYQALVIDLGGWFPDVHPMVVVVDPVLMASLGGAATSLVQHLKSQTAPDGLHVALAPPGAGNPISWEKWERYYEGWTLQRGGRTNWLMAKRP